MFRKENAAMSSRIQLKLLFRRVLLPLKRSAAEIQKDIRSSPLFNQIVSRMASLPLSEHILADEIFRAKLSLCASLIFNFLYAIIQFVSSIYYRSVWFGALAILYILLAAMRFLLLRRTSLNGNELDCAVEVRKYRICGVILLFMTPVFASILILVVHKNSHATYAGPLIYLMAIYAFCKIIAAIRSAIKFRKCGSPVISAAKVISLISAIMSILSLETAMLTRFEEVRGSAFHQAMIGTSGGAFCIFVFGIAIHMVNCTKWKKHPSS